MNNKENLLGVVLCGGESKRMGNDKGLLQINGKSWAAHIADKLIEQQLSVVISINEFQKDFYNQIFSIESLVIDQFPIQGPLNGLLTVHQHYPHKDVLLMACDLIDMNSSLLKQLVNAYEKNNADFFAYADNNFFQPLCAIYTSKTLQAILQNFTNGTLADYSFQSILNTGKTCKLYATSQKPFTNHNTMG